ncbi:hypothetical protein SAMN03080602_00932 [Arenibacter troitsensis]|uniref:Uncharacterized protein n=1 Tax=Arenibacter troitsensis TaxID=188872 RepID=A0A1X7IQC3_9FLAO|nr:hypothetical protein SAMN03080602_00932 [Arenibacter troitsensis]
MLGLPLLIYPFVLLANIMSAVAEPSNTSDFKKIIVQGFLLTSSLYPVSYFLSLLPFIRKRKYGFVISLIHLFLILVLFTLWNYLD